MEKTEKRMRHLCRHACAKDSYEPTGCSITNYCECRPEECEWYQTHDMWRKSIIKAARYEAHRDNEGMHLKFWLEHQPKGYFKANVYKVLREAGFRI